MIYLDTHVLVWLYSGNVELIPEKSVERIETEEIFISPMCELELQFLFETGKITEEAKKIISELAARIGLSTCTLSFEKIISVAAKASWTRDPFDRIIVSHARVQNAFLLTKDRTIQKHYPKAIWD